MYRDNISQTCIRFPKTRGPTTVSHRAARLRCAAAGLEPPPDDKLLSRAVNGILGFGLTNIDRPDGPARTICNVMSANCTRSRAAAAAAVPEWDGTVRVCRPNA